MSFIHVIATGLVQGVGYREFVRRAAEARGLAGFVRNLRRGGVEARIVGSDAALDEMLAEMRRGPPGGRVDGLDILARGASEPERGFP